MELLDKGNVTAALQLVNAYSTAVSKANKSDLALADDQDTVIEVISTAFDDVTKEKVADENVSKSSTICRHQIIKEIFKSLTGKVIKTCPHCKLPTQKVRQEYNSRLYLMPAGASTINKMKSANANSPGEGDNEDTAEQEAYVKQLSAQTFLAPLEVQSHLQELMSNDLSILQYLLGSYSHPTERKRVASCEMFFLNAVIVTPSRFRPLSSLGEKRFENPQTANLNKVLWDCIIVRELLTEVNGSPASVPSDGQVKEENIMRRRGRPSVGGATPAERLQNAWIKLQTDVMCVMDSDLDKLSKEKLPGVRQLLEKKEGLFRKNMMGKRVNFAARSVISPDPYINTDEIGIPEVFACKLTYPQPVTPWNCQELRQAIINGPNVHPGAVIVEKENGHKVMLSATNPHQREAIAKSLLTPSLQSDASMGAKKVHRHLNNGDVMLLNRQPTLHRPSMMAHKVRVLPNERTIRLHYANCKAYNADFDGDEMNAHFPQSELARSEAYHLGTTNNHYLSPKDGKPLSGLIQDFMVAGVLMTSRGTLYNRNDYQRLVYNALIDKQGPVICLRPCIIKPEPLWSGKQVVSTVLINVIPEDHQLINLTSKAKITDLNWARSKQQRECCTVLEDPHLLESEVIFRNGELLTGLLDKTQYGSTAYGLVHACYELYGGTVSGLLLSALGRLFTSSLQLTGFTLGVEDILVTDEADSTRSELMTMAKECGKEAALKTFGLPDDSERIAIHERLQKAHHSILDVDMKQLDMLTKRETDHFQNSVNSICIPYGLYKRFPSNSLQLMVQSGAKGSAVNCMQISCLLGQIELEGRRPPLMISGRSLPSFRPYETEPRAGGFVDGRFLTGIRPQEYFFHCMAGREGLIDTAVKTSRSGYLQRCLIKHLEGLRVQYDLTVRDGDGSVVQFMYGEDGLDIGKTAYLNNSQFDFVAENYKGYLSLLDPPSVRNKIDFDKSKEYELNLGRWKDENSVESTDSATSFMVANALVRPLRNSALFHFETRKRAKYERKYSGSERDINNSRNKVNLKLVKSFQKLASEAKERYETAARPCPDPMISSLRPDTHFGSVSENFSSKVMSYVGKAFSDVKKEVCCDGLVNKEKFSSLMMLKYQKSLSESGDAVGLLAGQSIGEPSTQMTLNTFHFAGRGEMNVTLGIPRLSELMTELLSYIDDWFRRDPAECPSYDAMHTSKAKEILMTASTAIKTPTMDMLVKKGKRARKRAVLMQKKWNKVCLSQVLQQVDVSESISSSASSPKSRVRRFKVRLQFLPHDLYKDDFALNPEKILLYTEMFFLRRIVNSVLKVVRAAEKSRFLNASYQESMNTSANGDEEAGANAATAVDEPDDEADVSDDDGDENGDATEAKQRSRRMQFSSYEGPEQEELEETNGDGYLDDADEGAIRGETLNEDLDQTTLDGDGFTESFRVSASKEKLARIKACRASHQVIVAYEYDDVDQLWCDATFEFPILNSKVMLVPLIESLASKAVVSEVLGISRCFLSESDTLGEQGRWRMRTEGVNIEEVWHYANIIDVNTIYSNDVHAVAQSYGIEAAQRVIIKEIKDVFKAYGIEIDPRHLSLVGDYMTFEGVYRPFNRLGIESNPFPFQKMSFETTTVFLRSASAFGQLDTLGSPSSRLIVGRTVSAGTGAFELIQPIQL